MHGSGWHWEQLTQKSNWLRGWLSDIRQEAIAWIIADHILRCHMVTLGGNELNQTSSWRFELGSWRSAVHHQLISRRHPVMGTNHCILIHITRLHHVHCKTETIFLDKGLPILKICQLQDGFIFIMGIIDTYTDQIIPSYQCLSERLKYLQCFSNGDSTVLH